MCSHQEEGDVRLTSGLSIYEGRVEVCTGGEWGTICYQNWNNLDALVVCRQLEFPTAGTFFSHFILFLLVFVVLSVVLKTKELLQLLGIVMEEEKYISVTLAALEMKSVFSHVHIHILHHSVHIQTMLVSFVEVC